jgi:hypothetical protein
MNKGYNEFYEQKITEFRRPPQVNSSKAQIFAKFHKIPTIRFEDQELTSFSGMIVFQLLFKRLGLRKRLKGCFSHLKISPIFGHHLVVMLLVTHLILGFNKARKGARSYYPLFCTIAQTGQFFDMHHRPGNVHDSNGAPEFMQKCFEYIRCHFPGSIIESRMDGAFFNQKIIDMMSERRISFTASVPFYRFTELKQLIETCDSWIDIDEKWSYFKTQWKPKSWNSRYQRYPMQKTQCQPDFHPGIDDGPQLVP